MSAECQCHNDGFWTSAEVELERGKPLPQEGTSEEPGLRRAKLAFLWPTLAKLAGISAPAGLPGIDLSDPAAVAGRERIFCESFRHNIAKLGEPKKSLSHRCVIEGKWKLIVPNPITLPQGEVELYDLAADPWEKKNLAGEQPERVKAMGKELDGWWKP